MIKKEHQHYVQSIEEEVERLHGWNPKYVFLTETGSIPVGYALKEAWKKAYPEEAPPKFLRVEPRTLRCMRYSAQESKTTKNKEEKEHGDKDIDTVNEFFRKRIKEPGRIFVYDEESETGNSPFEIVRILVDPTRYGFSPNIKVDSKNIRMTTPYRYLAEPEMAQYCLPGEREITGAHLNKIFHRGGLTKKTTTMSKSWNHRNAWGLNGGLTPMRRSRKDFKKSAESMEEQARKREKIDGYEETKDLREEVRVYRQGGPALIHYYKEIGREAGEELHVKIEKEKQKKKNLEDKLATIIGLIGISLSILFLSNFTGNIIGISKNISKWVGVVLFLIGIIGAFFYLRKKK